MTEDNIREAVAEIVNNVFNSRKDKEVEIVLDGVTSKVKIKKLTYGERNDVIRKAIGGKIEYVGDNKGILKVDPFDMREQMLFKCIVEAPFPHKTIEDIRNLDPNLAEFLADQAEELNPFRES